MASRQKSMAKSKSKLPAPTDELFDVTQAAAYLGVKRETIKYHLYVTKDLKASHKFQNLVVFTKQDLDEFREIKRPAHRPKKKH